jgi:branched-chain amino acid transport system ATP-binding protein
MSSRSSSAAESSSSQTDESRPVPGPRVAPSDAILGCWGITKRFGGLAALTDVTLGIPRGEILGLIGPNGAGKTTLFNCLSGFLQPDAGEVWLDEHRIDDTKADAMARAGVVRTFQTLRMFSHLTVYESLMAAQYCRFRAGLFASVLRLPRHRKELTQMTEDARDAMALLGLEGARDSICANLPLLAQRKVEMARAVLTRPRVLLLDEPSAGATPAESAELAAVVRRLNDEGMTILLIEHNVPFVTSLAHWVEVLHFGQRVASCPPGEVTSNSVVADIYLGVGG